MKYPIHHLKIGQAEIFPQAKINSLRVLVHGFSRLTGKKFRTSYKKFTPKVTRVS